MGKSPNSQSARRERASRSDKKRKRRRTDAREQRRAPSIEIGWESRSGERLNGAAAERLALALPLLAWLRHERSEGETSISFRTEATASRRSTLVHKTTLIWLL